ncbi:hypothetical protein [Flavisolibacter ginsengisoli]|jgi:hypothetical protein|nr:hypothetical protein [Flavisolibacter ginsengisoli]
MTVFILLVSFVLSLTLYGQKPVERKEKSPLNYSLFYSSKDVYLAFDEPLKPNVLTKQQLANLLTIIERVSDSLNLRVTSTNTKTGKIDTLRHNYQIVSAKDNKGQSTVWVNAVCDPKKDWKKELVFIEDGGSCYYNFRVNLSQKRYYNIAVNRRG